MRVCRNIIIIFFKLNNIACQISLNCELATLLLLLQTYSHTHTHTHIHIPVTLLCHIRNISLFFEN